MADEFVEALESAEPDRRAFLKKLAIGTAFAAPMVSSFTMTGIKAAYAQTAQASGGVSGGGVENTTTTSTSTSTSTTTTTQSNQAEQAD
ncbi:MAG: hypothetical protein QOD92_4198 [Acidimicrobiaceae bacterium]|jgi:hypothetical protein